MKFAIIPLLLFLFSANVFGQSSGFSEARLLGKNQLSGVYEIKPADMDGDGIIDIVAFADTWIGWLPNLGNGDFGDMRILAEAELEINAADVGDINGDGHPDLAWQKNETNVLHIKLNNGSGSFETHRDIPIENIGITLDIFIDENFPSGRVLLQSQYGSMYLRSVRIEAAEMVVDTLFESYMDVINTVQDLNGDGISDFVLSPRGRSPLSSIVSLSNMNSTYRELPIESSTPGAKPEKDISDIHPVDIDSDGDYDMISTTLWHELESPKANGLLILHRNDNNASFSNPSFLDSTASGFVSVQEMTVDEDSLQDLVAITGNGEVFWYPNEAGSYGPRRVLFENIPAISQLFLADINMDGEKEYLRFSQSSNQIDWIERSEDGSPQNQKLHLVAKSDNSAPSSVVSTDVDGDGLPDVVVGSQIKGKGLYWYKNSGNLTFSEPRLIDDEIGNIVQLASADVDGDGIEDIAALQAETIISGQADSSRFSLVWYKNNGNGSYGDARLIGERNFQEDSELTALASSFSVSDFTGNRAVDASVSFLNGHLIWFQNQGDGVFGEEQVILSEDYPSGASLNLAQDINGDGIEELITTHKKEIRTGQPPRVIIEYLSVISIYSFNSGESHFEQIKKIIVDEVGPNTLIRGVASDSFHGNGGARIIAGTAKMNRGLDLTPDQAIVQFTQAAGDTSWSSTLIAENIIDIAHLISVDIDNDGDVDLATSNPRLGFIQNTMLLDYRFGTINWYANQGDSVFSKWSAVDSLRDISTVGDMKLADLDNDGLPEIIAALHTEDKVAIYKNETDLFVSNEPNSELPNKISLHQNYPNPFNPTTVIRYQLPTASHVSLQVFDMLGRKVATLVDKPLSAGTHEARFDALRLASGMYIYQLKAGDFILHKKMMLVK